jgi:hypothetical protein
MFADLFAGLKGTCSQTHRLTSPVAVGLYWANDNPAEVTITIRHLTYAPDPAIWHVSRNALVVASLDSHLGTWAGAGSFAACHRGDTFTFAFKPPWLDKSQWAFVNVPAGAVTGFIDHSRRILDVGPAESEATLQLVDKALERILG